MSSRGGLEKSSNDNRPADRLAKPVTHGQTTPPERFYDPIPTEQGPFRTEPDMFSGPNEIAFEKEITIKGIPRQIWVSTDGSNIKLIFYPDGAYSIYDEDNPPGQS